VPKSIKRFCTELYLNRYESEKTRIISEMQKNMKRGKLGKKKIDDAERVAQKDAIKTAIIEGVRKYDDVDISIIWRAVYEAHVSRKSKVDSYDIISQVISADQSWKKSSGHAFEEVIKDLGCSVLNDSGISIILQRDLTLLIAEGKIFNDPDDIEWLRTQTEANVFDLYAVIEENEKLYCYGCIQSKTSIRDRVTRDREPSMHAMRELFWSAVIVLDGDFLKNKTFISMVNGGTKQYPSNGWHGMYVFSDIQPNGRIYPTNLELLNFAEHAAQAADKWLKGRKWLDSSWFADL